MLLVLLFTKITTLPESKRHGSVSGYMYLCGVQELLTEK